MFHSCQRIRSHSLGAFSSTRKLFFSVMIQNSWIQSRRKNVFKYHFQVHPVHQAYVFIKLFTDAENVQRLQQKICLYGIIWHHLWFKKCIFPLLEKRFCHMMLGRFHLSSYRIRPLRGYSALFLSILVFNVSQDFIIRRHDLEYMTIVSVILI